MEEPRNLVAIRPREPSKGTPGEKKNSGGTVASGSRSEGLQKGGNIAPGPAGKERTCAINKNKEGRDASRRGDKNSRGGGSWEGASGEVKTEIRQRPDKERNNDKRR